MSSTYTPGSRSASEKWINVFGDVEVIAALNALEMKAARPALKRAIGKGAKIIAAAARVAAPVKEGHLKKSIRTKVTKMLSGKVYVDPAAVWTKSSSGIMRVKFNGKTQRDKSRSRSAFFAAAAASDMDLIRPAKYAHLVEFGHLGRKKEGGGKGRSVPARPFMRPALALKRSECMATIQKEVKEAVEKLPQLSEVRAARARDKAAYDAWVAKMGIRGNV